LLLAQRIFRDFRGIFPRELLGLVNAQPSERLRNHRPGYGGVVDGWLNGAEVVWFCKLLFESETLKIVFDFVVCHEFILVAGNTEILIENQSNHGL